MKKKTLLVTLKNLKNKTLFSLVMLIAFGFTVAKAIDDDGKVKTVVSRQVQKTNRVVPAHLDYKPMASFADSRMKQLKRAAANGLEADFSVQGGSTQVTVWSENFDTDLSAWTVNNEVKDGWGPVTVELVSTASKRVPFTTYDEQDVTSLHFEGDYRVSKRNTAYATSGIIDVPANAQFHAYVGFTEWAECGLYIVVSTDEFATETELWNSKGRGISPWQWQELTLDLSEFAGQKIQVRFVYGEGTKNNYGVGGYMGDFYIDGVSITGVQTVDHVSVLTGETVQLADMSNGNPTKWEWSMPGAMLETSTEQNPSVYYTRPGDYDITLTVSDAEGTDVKTRVGFVHVDGQDPLAAIGTPATFRDYATRLPLVAPLVPVQWYDESEGFPTEWTWAFDFQGAQSTGVVIPEMLHEQNPWYAHNGLGKWNAVLVATNDSATSYATEQVYTSYGAGYSNDGMITNFREGEYATTFTDGELTFPGANDLGITAFAESFSKPSRPIAILGAYAYVTKAPTEVEISDVASITFALRKSDNGVPGEIIDMDTWTNTELGYALTNNSGMVQIEFSNTHYIDEPFFITIENIPAKSDAYELSFGMAPMRSEGNTAYMLRNNGEWRPFTGYFQAAPGGQTSLAVFPIVAHSVMTTVEPDDDGKLIAGSDTLMVSREAATVEQPFFSWLGYDADITSDAQWCGVVSTPNDMTLDTLLIHVDELPAGIDQRTAVLTITDGPSIYKLNVIQDGSIVTAITLPDTDKATRKLEVYDLNGRRMPAGRLPKGVYVVREGSKVYKRTY